jgi:hypothetical protein
MFRRPMERCFVVAVKSMNVGTGFQQYFADFLVPIPNGLMKCRPLYVVATMNVRSGIQEQTARFTTPKNGSTHEWCSAFAFLYFEIGTFADEIFKRCHVV